MMELVDVQDLGSCGAIRVGSSPTARTTSEQAAYRLLRLFPKAECARCAAPPFQIEPASLGFDLGAISKKIDFIHLLHDKMTDYTKGVVCYLLLEHTQPITPQ